MGEKLKTARRIIIILYLTTVHVLAAIFLIDYYGIGITLLPQPQIEIVSDPTTQEVVPTPLPIPSVLIPLTSEPETSQTAPSPSPELIIPVAGIKREQLTDTFTSARSNDRTHDAIDIMAPGGTPVLAAAGGEIIKFFDSQAGGITIYQLSADKRYVFYYAHLQSRAPDIKETDFVAQGTTIGYVGDTGNAGPGNYHLHFAIAAIDDPKNFWHGTYINPYPILMGQAVLP
jgi:murein DD-endopeptidase MepM/ murein hydrolase activator NlpD